MPEYLAPGVYVEEVSYRSKSLEGVSTSVAGFIGPTCYGPTEGEPELLTSFADFERIYGGIDGLSFADQPGEQPNFMAYAVRAFFDNGGRRAYAMRVFTPSGTGDGRASVVIASGPTLRARFPGAAGEMAITLQGNATGNLLTEVNGQRVIRRVAEHDVVLIRDRVTATPIPGAPDRYALYDVVRTAPGQPLRFRQRGGSAGSEQEASAFDPITQEAHLLTVTVIVRKPGRFESELVWENLPVAAQHPNSMLRLFTETPDSRTRYLTMPFAFDFGGATPPAGSDLTATFLDDPLLDQLELSLMSSAEFALVTGNTSPAGNPERPRPSDLQRQFVLSGGNDGNVPILEAYRGREAQRDPADPDIFLESTGLEAFAGVEEISMVAAPGHSFVTSPADLTRAFSIAQALIIHCERLRYRVALLDSPNNQAISEVRAYRGQFDSKYAAFYFPWVTILDLLDPEGRRELNVPPSGYVAGICARTDIQHGVFKAPANEVVLGALSFERLLNTAQQDVLNPEGINCFRFFEGRGYRLWGARTISSDPEWKYLNVRRYFAYLEHTLDRGTQWAVFENNGEALWANVRRTVEDFLYVEWRNGALLGLRPEDAFFVRCDRSTMSQNDLDNGRLICLVGVAVVKPAEFVIFRIGQWVADARR